MMLVILQMYVSITVVTWSYKTQQGLSCVQATSYLVTAWEALATQHEKTMAELPVVFEDVSIVQAVQAQPGENVTLSVLLDRSHRFQVPPTDLSLGCTAPTTDLQHFAVMSEGVLLECGP